MVYRMSKDGKYRNYSERIKSYSIIMFRHDCSEPLATEGDFAAHHANTIAYKSVYSGTSRGFVGLCVFGAPLCHNFVYSARLARNFSGL